MKKSRFTESQMVAILEVSTHTRTGMSPSVGDSEGASVTEPNKPFRYCQRHV
jgi:hypothetical protein